MARDGLYNSCVVQRGRQRKMEERGGERVNIIHRKILAIYMCQIREYTVFCVFAE